MTEPLSLDEIVKVFTQKSTVPFKTLDPLAVIRLLFTTYIVAPGASGYISSQKDLMRFSIQGKILSLDNTHKEKDKFLDNLSIDFSEVKTEPGIILLVGKSRYHSISEIDYETLGKNFPSDMSLIYAFLKKPLPAS